MLHFVFVVQKVVILFLNPLIQIFSEDWMSAINQKSLHENVKFMFEIVGAVDCIAFVFANDLLYVFDVLARKHEVVHFIFEKQTLLKWS